MSDDDEWEAWLALSDAQQDAIVEREMRAYMQWFESLTPLQQYRHCRKRAVDTCLRWRKVIRQLDLPVFHTQLRASQRSLLRVRVGFYHGTKGSTH